MNIILSIARAVWFAIWAAAGAAYVEMAQAAYPRSSVDDLAGIVFLALLMFFLAILPFVAQDGDA